MSKTKMMVALLALLALAMPVAGTHVEPTTRPGPTGNATCSDFAPEGAEWDELKVDPPIDGLYTKGDFAVLVDFHDNDDGDPKTFDFTASGGVVHAVFVKAGNSAMNGGHNLYEYDPPVAEDTGLRSPRDTGNPISHVSFCFTLEEEPTCEDNPDMPECQPTCEDNPDMPECQPPCVINPDLPECQPNCENNPDMPECQVECPTSITATAHGDGSITVHVKSTDAFDLYRAAGDEDPELVGSFDGDTDYLDTNTTVGVTYTYWAIVGPADCGSVEVTAIPVFPSALAALAAVGIAIAGYVGLRRRS